MTNPRREAVARAVPARFHRSVCDIHIENANANCSCGLQDYFDAETRALREALEGLYNASLRYLADHDGYAPWPYMLPALEQVEQILTPTPPLPSADAPAKKKCVCGGPGFTGKGHHDPLCPHSQPSHGEECSP